MRQMKIPLKCLWFMPLLLSALAAGCSGSRTPILGSDDATAAPPTVIAVVPANGATGVATNTTVTATFNQMMNPITAATFTVTCAAPCVSPTGTVQLDATHTVATFTLTPATVLLPLTQYTATVTGATSAASGSALAAPYVWKFTTVTGAVPLPPTVTAVAPANNLTNVPINLLGVVASFSEPVRPLTGAASFTVTCAAPCVSPAGTVSLNAANTTATFTLPLATPLAPLTLYTATVTGAGSLATGLAMTSPYVWNFTTGAVADITRPTVTLTVPATSTPGPTTGVPANTAITAAFSEDMEPSSINAASFTVTCAAPCVTPSGTVTYQVSSKTAVFTPAAALDAGSTYTATVTSAATDLSGNALQGNQAPSPAAGNYVWTFSAVAAVPPANISVLSTSPALGATTVCPSAGVNATFTVPSGPRMDPNTVNSGTFTVVGPAPGSTPVVASSVTLDPATGRIATFTPLAALTNGLTYTATIEGGAGGVKDLAVPANTMLNNYVWTFTVGPATGNCLQPVSLKSASTYGTFGGSAGMTNTGIITVINGDIGTIATGTSAVTGFNDTAGDVYTETPANIGTVNGTIYTCTNSTTGPTSTGPNAVYCGLATQARLDAQSAYLALVNEPAGPDPGGNLASLTLAPGVWTSSSGSILIQGGNLTLDAGGNANAVWVFQMASTLTVGGPGVAAPQSIILAGGAQAKNVFWQVGTSATINAGGGGTMVGTIISQDGVTFSTVGKTSLTTLNGRAISLVSSITMVDTVINVPAP
jgi:hypothetical protein